MKVTLVDALECVVVAATVAEMVQVPTTLSRPTSTDDCAERIDIIAIVETLHTLGVRDVQLIAPPPADGAAVRPGPSCVTV